ncbi:MAG TPA: peptidoglycan editing factor PgeF, partial [Burkholderiaceae bacterium]
VGEPAPSADASFTTRPGVVCCVTVADCLPVLLADARARAVGVAHAGWRGLAAGVIQNTVDAMRRAIGDPRAGILAYLGPAIGPRHFEVGAEVLSAMRQHLPDAAAAVRPHREDRYLADLFALARQALAQVAVDEVYGGGDCTASDRARFYSYRRDGRTGRHAALIWIESEPAC